jgi:hypothetical protein
MFLKRHLKHCKMRLNYIYCTELQAVVSQFILVQLLTVLRRSLTSSFVTPAVTDNDMAFLVHDLSAAVFGRGAIVCLSRAQSVIVPV